MVELKSRLHPVFKKHSVSTKLCTSATKNILGLSKIHLVELLLTENLVQLLSRFFLFFSTRARRDIINTAFHLSRTASHLANVRRKVCQWSIGQSTRDLWNASDPWCFYPWSSVYKAQSPASHLWQTATSHHKVSDNGPAPFCMSNRQHRAISTETDDWISRCLCQYGEDLIGTHCCQRIRGESTITASARRSILPIVCERSSIVWEELHRLLHCLPTWTALISCSRREETLFYCYCVVVFFF